MVAALPDHGKPLVESFDGLLLDLDGVVYVGRAVVPNAVETLTTVATLGVVLGYVTNNAARSAVTIADHITSFGIPCRAEQVVTSADLAARWLAEKFASGAAVLVIGGEGLFEAVEKSGLAPVREAAANPVAVVQGFGPDVGWRELAQGSYALDRAVPWVVTNLDLTVPTPEGRALGNGALVEALRASSGRAPEIVTGKPAPELFLEAARRWHMSTPLVVGDRLDTDIEGANAAKLSSLLVLTGVSGVAELLLAPRRQRPTFIGRDLSSLLHPSEPISQPSHPVVCGAWQADVVSGQVELTGSGDPLDALRAACAAAWSIDLDVVQQRRLVDRLEPLLADTR